jgi:hypothetical protein
MSILCKLLEDGDFIKFSQIYIILERFEKVGKKKLKEKKGRESSYRKWRS